MTAYSIPSGFGIISNWRVPAEFRMLYSPKTSVFKFCVGVLLVSSLTLFFLLDLNWCVLCVPSSLFSPWLRSFVELVFFLLASFTPYILLLSLLFIESSSGFIITNKFNQLWLGRKATDKLRSIVWLFLALSLPNS